MPGTGQEPAAALTPSAPDALAAFHATGASQMTGAGAAKSSPADIDLPWPAYAAIASLALRAEDLAPAEPPSGERPFVGYDRERALFARLRRELLDRAQGLYIALVGDEMEGPFDTFEEALRAGWRRFGPGPLYVKQITAEGSAAEAVDNPACQS